MNESDADEDNLYDIFKFSIFNPGTGFIITTFKSIENFEFTKIILSFIGTIFGLLLMFCPYITGFAVYLIKTINSLKILFLIKIHLLSFGIFGTFFSIIYAFLQKDINKEIKNPFDINCCDLCKIASNFGSQTVMRIIANLILPGTGTFSLLYKFGSCDIGIFFTALIQFINGIFFHAFNIAFIIMEINSDEDDYYVFYAGALFLNFFYYSGIYIILYLDYFDEWPHECSILSPFIMTFLNIVTGCLGDILQISNYKFTSDNCCCKFV
jgi:hypothetical protein